MSKQKSRKPKENHNINITQNTSTMQQGSKKKEEYLTHIFKNRIQNKYAWVFLAMMLPAAIYAQEAIPVPPAVLLSGSRFFVALVSGLILAVGFQLLLTNLSVAAGLSMIGPVSSPAGQKAQPQEPGGVQQTVRKISSAFGIWTLVTASISLFFASLLGVRLGVAVGAAAGATLGLVIWGLFYTLSFILESSVISSMVGALGRFAASGLRSAYEAATSVFRKSPEEQAADTAAKITQAVRGEIFGDMDAAEIRGRIQNYINQLKPSVPGPDQIARSIAGLLSDTEIKIVSSPDWHQSFLTFLEKQEKMNKENAQALAGSLQKAISAAKEEAHAPKEPAAKVADTAMRTAGMSGKEAQETRQKVENYLRSTGKQQLSPEGIKHDIEELLRSPKAGAEALKARAASIDKSTVTALLAQRKDISPEEAKRVVDRVDQVLKEITGNVQETAGKTQGKAEATRDTVLARIKDYLDSLNQPELKYEGLQRDVQTLLHDPEAGSEALLRRFKSIDRDTLRAILSSRKDISEQDAEQIISRIESTRDQLVRKAEQMKDEVSHRLEAAKDEVMRQAEETRKTAASAAWWVFIIAAVSGIAAMVGGMMGAVRI